MYVSRMVAASLALVATLTVAPVVAQADGNVLAYVTNQSLYVFGDDAANTIDVTQGAFPDEFVVTPSAGTTVNSAFGALVLGGVLKDVRIEMNGGTDDVGVGGLAVPRNLSIKMEMGSDVLAVEEVLVGKNATLSGGDEGDFLLLEDFDVTGKLKVRTDDGDDDLEAAEVTVGRNVKLSGGNGNDTIGVAASTFDNKCAIVTNGGMDEVELLDVAISGKTKVSLGADDDYIALGDVFADSRVVLNGGSGFNVYDDLGGNNIAEGPILKKF